MCDFAIVPLTKQVRDEHCARVNTPNFRVEPPGAECSIRDGSTGQGARGRNHSVTRVGG